MMGSGVWSGLFHILAMAGPGLTALSGYLEASALSFLICNLVILTIGLRAKGDSEALRIVPGPGRALQESEPPLLYTVLPHQIQVTGREHCPVSGKIGSGLEFLCSICAGPWGVDADGRSRLLSPPSGGWVGRQLSGEPEAPAGRKLQRPVESDSSGLQVPDGPLTSDESILREGCWRNGPVTGRLCEQPSQTTLFFHLLSSPCGGCCPGRKCC